MSYIPTKTPHAAFIQGYNDFFDGYLDNPYNEREYFSRHREWQYGFDRAYFDNLAALNDVV